jgi:hypothetical protein
MISDILADHTCPCGCADPTQFKRIRIDETDRDIWWMIRCAQCGGLYALHVSHIPKEVMCIEPMA